MTWSRVSLVLRAALVLLAAWALRRELVGLDGHALVSAVGEYDAWRIALSFAVTGASFLLLGVIELMALRFAGRRDVPASTGLLTGFIANAMSQAIGVALLTGAAVRVRAYQRYAVTAGDIARISAFVTFTVTLGLLTTGAAAFMASPEPLPVWHITVPTRGIGAVLAILVLAYLGWSGMRGRALIGRGTWRIARPRPMLALAQVALASLDWIVTGSLLYLLLPAAAAVGIVTSIRVYLIAQTMGTLSHVPGGAGVFELLVLALLAPMISPSARAPVVASLVVFRAMYYLVPLIAASVIAGLATLRLNESAMVVHAD